MDKIEILKSQKENLQEVIYKELDNLTEMFKEYVVIEHQDYPKHIMIENIWYRNNYGCKDNMYYYWLPNDVFFVHRYSLWKSTAIYYDDNLNCWFVYNKEKENYTEFNSLDINSQIAILEQIYKFLKL